MSTTPYFRTLAGIGNLGVGTTSPTSNLQVVGNAYVSNALLTTNVLATTINATTINVSSSLILSSPLPVSSGGTGTSTAVQNAVFAGPASGGSGAPAFRALASGDIPNPLSVATIYGTIAGSNTVSASNVLVASGAPASIVQGSNVAVFSNAAGTGTVVINSSGQVGIGTAAVQPVPAGAGSNTPILFVYGTSTSRGALIQTTGGSAGTANVCINTDGTNPNIELRSSTNTGSPYIDFAASNPSVDYDARMILVNNGNTFSLSSNIIQLTPTTGVGIGTASPTQLLTIGNGNILFTGTWSAGTTYSVQGYNTDKRLEFNYSNGTVIYDNNAFLVRTGGASGSIGNLGLYQNSSAQVGIGTASPLAVLQVSGSTGGGSGYGNLVVDTAASSNSGGCVTIRNSAGGNGAFASLVFEVDGSTAVVSGNNPNPTSFNQGNGFLYCQNTNGTNNASKIGLQLWNGSAETEVQTWLPSGNVGIGMASPSYPLDVSGKIRSSQLALVGYTDIVNRRPFWGVGAWTGSNFNNFTTTTDTSYSLIYAYGPFAYGVPAVATGATRYFRIYAQWGDNLQQGNWYIDFIPQTSGSTVTFTMPFTWGAPGTPRDGYSNSVADPGSNFNYHGTIYIRGNITGKASGGGNLNPTQVQINYLELQAIDQY